ncbi:MAG: HesB/IscA family protein [Capsulimonadaceae bacterium]
MAETMTDAGIGGIDTIDAAVEFTEGARTQMRRVLARKGGAFMRIGVKGGGCSGLSYIFKPDSEVDDIDRSWLLPDGLRVVTDERSLKYIRGMTVDYDIRNLMEGGFKFQNPNATKSCGCGTSFTPR